MKKRLLLLLLVFLPILTGCGKQAEISPYADIPKPTCVITMSSGATMTFTLDPASAPNTVSNFINLANAGFYDGMKIDYVYPTFFIKSGDPVGDGTGEPGYSIAGEFSKNGYTLNNLSHERGVISMCRLTDDYNSAGCQFFIMHSTRLEYDDEYAAFGWIEKNDAKSFETLDAICSTTLDKEYRPLLRQSIQSVRVDTKGYTYDLIKFGDEPTLAPTAAPTPEPNEEV
ncbi:MAG: peptidylprolyl isomerase [Clostridia bacterium]|nr:peptidylprolyl isomerase [Clostridia bacterium]